MKLQNYMCIVNPVENISICVDWTFLQKKVQPSCDLAARKTSHHKITKVLCISGSAAVKEKERKQSKQNYRIYKCTNFVLSTAISNVLNISPGRKEVILYL